MLSLPMKVQRLHFRIEPPFFPRFRFTLQGAHLARGAEIALHGVIPNVDHLVLVAGDRDADAPVDIAGDGPATQFAAFGLLFSVVEDGLSPVTLVAIIQPFCQMRTGFAQIDEEVLGFPNFDLALPADLAARGFQFGGIVDVTAFVALVTASVGVATHRASPFDVTVGQEALRRPGNRAAAVCPGRGSRSPGG